MRGRTKSINPEAARRAAQHAIDGRVLNWLSRYGAKRHDHQGRIIRYFDKTSHRRARVQLQAGDLPHFEKKSTSYLVTDLSGVIVKVGHCNGRFHRL